MCHIFSATLEKKETETRKRKTKLTRSILYHGHVARSFCVHTPEGRAFVVTQFHMTKHFGLTYSDSCGFEKKKKDQKKEKRHTHLPHATTHYMSAVPVDPPPDTLSVVASNLSCG